LHLQLGIERQAHDVIGKTPDAAPSRGAFGVSFVAAPAWRRRERSLACIRG
jgi:hypothetical protein